MANWQVWVDTIIQASGRIMCNGFIVDCLLIISSLERRKCPVVPDSKIPWSIGVWSSLFATLLHTSFVKLACTTILIILCSYEFADLDLVIIFG